MNQKGHRQIVSISNPRSRALVLAVVQQEATVAICIFSQNKLHFNSFYFMERKIYTFSYIIE